MNDSTQKEQIADAFQRYFNHFGFKKTSVGEVARELSISKKTIYQHFSSKEEIFYYVVSRVARHYRARMERQLEPLLTYRLKLEKLIRLIFAESRQWLRDNDAFEFRYKARIAELAFQDTYAELIADLLEGGMEAGEFARQPVEMTARFVRGILSESMDVLQSDPERPVEEPTVQAILKLLE